jgi:UDP-glucose 4-epimerase
MIDDVPRRVAITGIAGYLGRELAAQFDIDPLTKRVLGLDVAPYTPPSEKVVFVQRSVEEPFADLFVEHKVDAAIHLAFVVDPTHDRAREQRINIEGTRHFLDACAKAKVKTVLVASSAAAYGARSDNPEVLYEGAPLRATPDIGYAHDKVRIEELCYEFAKSNPDVCLQIVRPCIVIGPHADHLGARLLRSRIILAPRGYNPPIQLIHEDDAVRAIVKLLRSRQFGVFNLAADGAVTYRKIAEIADSRIVRLPRFLFRWLISLGWRLGWRWLAAFPPSYLDYFCHRCVVSNIKLKTELLFLFKYDATRALRHFLEGEADPIVTVPDHLRLAEDEDEEDEEEEDQEEEDELEEIVEAEPAPSPAPPVEGGPPSAPAS